MISKILLDRKAVHLSPDHFFTWASGIKSPIYCDNRKIISAPKEREIIVNAFIEEIQKRYPNIDCIAGTATAGIPWAAWIADKMQKPMIYIRSGSKSHGLKNALEGEIQPGEKVIIIEDLISTGGSSLKAAQEVIEFGCEVLGVASIFTYGMSKAKDNFKEANIDQFSLDNLSNLLDYAQKEKLLDVKQIGIIKEWKKQHLS